MEIGWYPNNYNYCNNLELYLTTRPLNDNQQVIMMAENVGRGHYEIAFGVFPKNYSFKKIINSGVWLELTSTNEKPNFRTAILGVDCLRECEKEIKRRADGKRRIIYIGAMDKRRMKAYKSIINRYNLGYKISSIREDDCFDNSIFKLYKVI